MLLTPLMSLILNSKGSNPTSKSGVLANMAKIKKERRNLGLSSLCQKSWKRTSLCLLSFIVEKLTFVLICMKCLSTRKFSGSSNLMKDGYLRMNLTSITFTRLIMGAKGKILSMRLGAAMQRQKILISQMHMLPSTIRICLAPLLGTNFIQILILGAMMKN